MDLQESVVRAIGEIALRVDDLDAMQKFYQEAIGLEVLRRFPNAVFFRVAEGYGGHTQVLALFDRSLEQPGLELSAQRSTIDHIAFTISLSDYVSEKRRLEGLGLKVETAKHTWVHWRSLYVHDPEGNEVELVCYDSSV